MKRIIINIIEGGVCIRRNRADLPHDRSHLLIDWGASNAPTGLFRASISRWMEAHISDDCASDIGTGEVVDSIAFSKSSGVFCGRIVIEILIKSYFPSCTIFWHVEEGARISNKERILTLTGPSSSVLSCERVLLNILGRMSGIATLTSRWVSEADGIGVACTRKTAWGLMDKWAVHIGGGLTHRLSREDALMIKENDLSVMSPGVSSESSISSFVSSIELGSKNMFTTIEVQDPAQAIVAVRAWAERRKINSGLGQIVVLLDNMGPVECGVADHKLRNLGLREVCILEGSGGIKLEELSDWTGTGVDVISSSEVNMGSRSLDFSMLIGEA